MKREIRIQDDRSNAATDNPYQSPGRGRDVLPHINTKYLRHGDYRTVWFWLIALVNLTMVLLVVALMLDLLPYRQQVVRWLQGL